MSRSKFSAVSAQAGFDGNIESLEIRRQQQYWADFSNSRPSHTSPRLPRSLLRFLDPAMPSLIAADEIRIGGI